LKSKNRGLTGGRSAQWHDGGLRKGRGTGLAGSSGVGREVRRAVISGASTSTTYSKTSGWNL